MKSLAVLGREGADTFWMVKIAIRSLMKKTHAQKSYFLACKYSGKISCFDRYKFIHF